LEGFLSFAPESGELIFMPDKPKAKTPRQVSLLDAQEERADDVDRMVSQAFDSDPSVRMKVAQGLSRIDDPRAIFALIELSSDKDEAVKETAQRALGNFKEEKEDIVSIGKLLSERKAQPQAAASTSSATAQSPVPQSPRANMMPAIERLFAHYEPKKRESARRKLLPSLRKLFGFRPEELDPLQELDKISGTQPMPREESQYGEAKLAAPQNAANFPFGKHEEPREERHKAETEVDISDEDAEFVGGHDAPAREMPEGEETQRENDGLSDSDGIYHYALHMASTPGIGKADLKREQNRLITDFKRRAELAFKLAAEQACQDGCATFSGIKPGMKNLSFAEMAISSISEMAYGQKRKPYARIMLFDGKREMALLVPRERSNGITTQDRVAAKKVTADFLVEKNEVVLLVGPKSAVVVYK
jgi:hypothetical protein